MTLQEYIKESLKSSSRRINEDGIDLDYRQNGSSYIAYNPNHQQLLNTSLEHNPTVDKTIIPDVEVWSVFKRNREGTYGLESKHDGNPVIHAFKQEGVWRFKSKKTGN